MCFSQASVGALTQTLGETLIELDNQWVSSLLGPLNSIAGVIGATLLALQYLYRKFVR